MLRYSLSLIRSIAVAACFTVVNTAYAAAPTESSFVEEVVITGSRIVLPNVSSTSPIQVVTEKDIQISGRSDISDVINLLPQNFVNSFADFNGRTSALTTAGGLATADLRGLGPQRTLVLVNGRRLGVADANTANPNPAPDLDQIPTALIERVDVVTGGASAVYGSDAIAGVINFILKRDFEGVEIDGQMGENWHQQHSSWAQDLLRAKGYDPHTGTIEDGRNRSLSFILGSNIADGRGNVTAYFGYQRADPVPSGNRDFGACQLFAGTGKDGNFDHAFCGGSPNSNIFFVKGNPYSVSGNQFVPWGSVPTTPPSVFNSQQYIYNGRDDLRYTAGYLAHVDINEHVKPYSEFAFMNDRTDQKIAPSALFLSANPLDPTGNGAYNVNCSNSLLSAQEASLLCTPAEIAADAANPGSVTANVNIGRRNIEGGGRESYYEHTNYRAVVGLKGDLFSGWTYDAYGQYYYTTFFNSNKQYLNFQSIDNALLVKKDPSGNPVCISGSPCVPYNIFKDGGVTPDALQYLYLNGTASGTNVERTVHADITGDLGRYGVKSPLATNGFSVNLGYEYRADREVFEPDSGEGSGLLSGFGGAAAPIHQSFSVDEGFLEFGGALVEDKPGIKSLVMDAGYRHSKYTTSAGSINTGKFELQYQPTTDLRLRGSYQRATRAPNLIELFNPPVVGLVASGDDPCAPNEVTGIVAASLVECMRTGVTAAQYAAGIPQCSANQCSGLLGGNANLQPERATSFNLGATLTPSFLSGFSGSVDYWQIRIKNVIGAVPPGLLLQGCLSSGDPFLCAKVVRNTTNGALVGTSITGGGYVDQTALNIGEVKTSGVDFQGTYSLHLRPSLGALNFGFNGVLLLSSDTTPYPGSGSYDCTGLFGALCQTVNPRWRHTLLMTWATPWNVDLSATWRYFRGVSIDNNDPNPLLHGRSLVNQVNGGPGIDYLNARIPAYNWLDLSVAWKVAKELQIRAGINNVLDKDPPIITSEITPSGANNTYEAYDTLGRQLFVAFTARF